MGKKKRTFWFNTVFKLVLKLTTILLLQPPKCWLRLQL